MNGNKKTIIGVLITIVFMLFAFAVSYVLHAQAKTDARQDDQLKEIRMFVEENTKQLGIILDQFKRVNLVELNATVKSIDGRTQRLENSLLK